MDARTCILLVLVNIFQMVHQCSDSTAQYGVLFVFDSWEPDKGGLNGFHRNLIKEFLRRKDEQIKVYSTIVDTEITDEILEDAKSLDVTLISPKQKGRMDSSTDKPRVEWLILHESYYPDLRRLKNIKFVVGYAPKTANAAAEIRDSLFRNAYLVVINHVIPDIRDSSYDFVTREKQMQTWAAEANITFSIGPKIFEHFENVFRLETLRLKPHKEYLPRPDRFFFQKNATLGNLKKLHVLFSYGKSDNGHELNNYDTFVNTFSDVQHNFQNMGKHPPELKVRGSDIDIDNMLRNAGIKYSKCTDQSSRVFADCLLQSHLYLITNCFSEYSFDALEAMAVGIPVLAPRDSHIAWFFDEYFKEHEHRCVVKDIQHEWPRRITEVLTDIVTAFKRAGDLMEEFNKSNDVCESHDRFAAILKLKTNSTEKGDGRIRKDLDASPEIAIGSDISLKDPRFVNYLRVNIDLNQSIYDKKLEEYEQREQCASIERQRNKTDNNLPYILGLLRIMGIWEYMKDTLSNIVHVINGDEKLFEKLTGICLNNSANLIETNGEDLSLKLTFSSLFDLHKFEGKCRSGLFAKELEALLITDEMREKSDKLNVQPQLQVTYKQNNYKEIEDFFIQRYGEQTHAETWIARDGTDLVIYDQLDASNQQELWPWFIYWIDPLYAINLIIVVVIAVTLAPSIKSVDDSIVDDKNDEAKKSEKEDMAGKSNPKFGLTKKPQQLLYLELDPLQQFNQSSIKAYFSSVHAADKCIRLKGQHCDILQVAVKKSAKLQQTLHSKHDILNLLGIRKYLWRNMRAMYTTISAVQEQISERGIQTAQPDKYQSTLTRSLSLGQPLGSTEWFINKLHGLQMLKIQSQFLQNELDDAKCENVTLKEQVVNLNKVSETVESRLVKQLLDINSKNEKIQELESLISELETSLSEYAALKPPELQKESLEENKEHQEMKTGDKDQDSDTDKTSSSGSQQQTPTEQDKIPKEDAKSQMDREKNREKKGSGDNFSKVTTVLTGDPRKKGKQPENIEESDDSIQDSENIKKKWDSADIMSVQPINQRPAVLIISDRWGLPFEGGASAAVRLLAYLFNKVGLNVYCTVLKMTEQESVDAKKHNVTLISPAPRKGRKRKEPHYEWYYVYEVFFPKLLEIDNVEIVVGFSFITSDAASFISQKLAPKARYYLANVWPPDVSPVIVGCDDDELRESLEQLEDERI
ncbi:uncharacterized protein LOC144448173 [Glandiceps talaboti]